MASFMDTNATATSEDVFSVPADGMDEYLPPIQETIQKIWDFFLSIDEVQELEDVQLLPADFWSFLDSTDLTILRCYLGFESSSWDTSQLEGLLPEDVLNLSFEEMTRTVLQKIQKSHWVLGAMIAIGLVLENVKSINEDMLEDCAEICGKLFNLACVLRNLKFLPQRSQRIAQCIEQYVELIVRSAIICCSQREPCWFPQNLCNSVTRESLEALKEVLDESNRRTVCEFIIYQAHILNEELYNGQRESVESSMEKIIEMLEFESEKNVVAVILQGPGGLGKTTIADWVHLGVKVDGYRSLRVVLFHDGEKTPITTEEKLQAMIQAIPKMKNEENSDDDEESDLESEEDSWDQSVLLERLRQQFCFVYIDNVLDAQELSNLLPMDLGSVKCLRLLITATDPAVKDMFCIPNPQDIKVFEVLPMTSEQAMKLLKSEMGPEVFDCISSEDVGRFLDICRGVPLALKIVARFIAMADDKNNACKSIRKLRNYGTENEDFFVFAFDGLEENLRDTFLDICSFFHGNRWAYVENIFGADVLRVLENRGLIMKNHLDLEKGLRGAECPERETLIKVHDVILETARRVCKREGTRITEVKQLQTLFNDDQLDNKERLCKIKGILLVENEMNADEEAALVLFAEQLDIMSSTLRIFSSTYMDVFMGLFLPVLSIEGKCTATFPNLIYFEHSLFNVPIDVKGSPRLTYLSYQVAQVVDLSELPQSLRSLGINMDTIESEESMPTIFSDSALPHLQSLTIQSSGCSVIPEGSLSKMTSLQTLKIIDFPNLIELPDDLHELPNLKTFWVENCYSLIGLPWNFGRCPSLKVMALANCPGMEKVPENVLSLASVHMEIVNCGDLQRNMMYQSLQEGIRSETNVRVSFGGMNVSFTVDEDAYSLNLF